MVHTNIGLPFSTDDNALYEAFKGFGNCVEAKVCYDRETGNSRGFGFVTFDNADAVAKATSGMDGQDFGGRYLSVKKAMQKAEKEKFFADGGADRACYGCGEKGHQSRNCPKAKIGGGNRDCFDFKKGNCSRGDMCRFKHEGTGHTGGYVKAPCFAFQSGNCDKGASCRFSHDVEADGSKAPAAATPASKKDAKTKKTTFEDEAPVEGEGEAAPAAAEGEEESKSVLGKRVIEEAIEGGSPAKKAKEDFNWKKTITATLKGAEGSSMSVKDLRKEVLALYKKSAGEDESSKDQLKELFEEKLAKVKKVSVEGKVATLLL
jgi:hypothetical protein